MTQVEQIKAEIERRMLEDYNSSDAQKDEIAQGVCAGILTFINSLQGESMSEDLEEAVDGYTRKVLERTNCLIGNQPVGEEISKAVKFGAEWLKEQMLKDAKCVEVFDDWKYGKDTDFTAQPAIKLRDSSLEIGKQVKLIIIKED